MKVTVRVHVLEELQAVSQKGERPGGRCGVAMLFPVLSCGCTLSRGIGACREDGQRRASPVSQSLEEEQGLCDREGEDVQGQGRAAGERPE